MSQVRTGGQVCTACVAFNRDDADHCWQCYTSFQPRSAASGSPLLRALSGSRPALPPPDRGRSQWAESLNIGVSNWVRVLLAVGLTAVGGVSGLIYMMDPLPDTVGGKERIESIRTEDEVEVRIERDIRVDGVEVEVALYGSEAREELDFAIYQIDLPDGMSLAEYAAPGGTWRAPPVLVNLIHRDFHCDHIADPAMCAWHDGDDVVALAGWDVYLGELKPIAREIRRAMQD